MSNLIGATDAAALLHTSPQLVRYWTKTGRVRCVRRHPLRFRVEDVIALVREGVRPNSTGRPPGKNKQLNRVINEVLA